MTAPSLAKLATVLHELLAERRSLSLAAFGASKPSVSGIEAFMPSTSGQQPPPSAARSVAHHDLVPHPGVDL